MFDRLTSVIPAVRALSCAALALSCSVLAGGLVFAGPVAAEGSPAGGSGAEGSTSSGTSPTGPLAEGCASIQECRGEAPPQPEFNVPASSTGGSGSSSSPASTPVHGSAALAQASVAVHAGRVALVRLNCLGDERCRGKLTLAVRGTSSVRAKASRARAEQSRAVTIGHATFAIAGDETKGVDVELNGAGRVLVRAHHGRLTARLTILELEPGRGTQTVRVRLAGAK